MKTLRIITILSLVQFIAFTSFGKTRTDQRVGASFTSSRVISLLKPKEFAALSSSSSLEANMILKNIVNDTLKNSSRVSYVRMDQRIEALLKAVHATGKSSYYQHLAFLKTESFKGNLDRVLKKISKENRRAAQVIELNLESDSVI